LEDDTPLPLDVVMPLIHAARSAASRWACCPDVGDLVLLAETSAALPDAAKVEAAADTWPALALVWED